MCDLYSQGTPLPQSQQAFRKNQLNGYKNIILCANQKKCRSAGTGGLEDLVQIYTDSDKTKTGTRLASP